MTTEDESYSDFLKSVGVILREFREDAGYSQRQAAAEWGGTQNRVSKFENGVWDFKFKTLVDYCAIYGVTVNVDFIVGKEEELEDAS